jgi:hypothetical protein
MVVQGGVITKNLYRCTIDGVRVEDITDSFIGGSVRYQERDGVGNLVFTMELIGPEVVTPLADFVSPFVTYTFDDGTTSTHRLGVYVVGQPDAVLTQTTARTTYPCEDLTAVARDAVFTGVYKVASGTNIATAIQGILEQCGLVNIRLPRTTKTTGYKRAFPIGTTNLDAANSLCDAARWWKLGMALDGAITTQPSRLLSQSQPVRTYTNDDYIGEVLHKPTRGMVGNTVIVRRERSDQPTLYAKRYLTDTSNPLSHTRIGREILYGGAPYDARDAEDQDDVDAIADRMIEEAQSYERTIDVTVPPEPSVLGNHRVLDFDLETDLWDVYGRYFLSGWEIGLDPQSAAMRLTCQRLVRFLRGEDVN